MTHAPIPTSESGRVDTIVYCSECRRTLFLDEDGHWQHSGS